MRPAAPPFHEDTRLHLFSLDIASNGDPPGKFDIPGAILLTDLARNIKKIMVFRENKAYRKTEGWYYISVKELAKRHPYLGERTVRRTLDRLRRTGVLKTTKEFHKRKSMHTLWYSFADKETFKEALAKEDAISFWVQDAVEFGVEAAIILRNLTWVEEHGISTDGWTAINPVDFLDATNLPMYPQTVRRALAALVKGGRLERRRHARYGNNYYEYRLVDSPHLQSYEERDAPPTESYETTDSDDLPTEWYENVPPLTAHTEPKHRETRMLSQFDQQVQKIKSDHAKSSKPKRQL